MFSRLLYLECVLQSIKNKYGKTNPVMHILGEGGGLCRVSKSIKLWRSQNKTKKVHSAT